MKKKDIWFARKTYGYGWTPNTAQGWMLIVLFLLIQVILGMLPFYLDISTNAQVGAYFALTTINVVWLLVLTMRHAPAAKWQWGGAVELNPVKKPTAKKKTAKKK